MAEGGKLTLMYLDFDRKLFCYIHATLSYISSVTSRMWLYALGKSFWCIRCLLKRYVFQKPTKVENLSKIFWKAECTVLCFSLARKRTACIASKVGLFFWESRLIRCCVQSVTDTADLKKGSWLFKSISFNTISCSFFANQCTEMFGENFDADYIRKGVWKTFFTYGGYYNYTVI